jgi:hypothetical protein
MIRRAAVVLLATATFLIVVADAVLIALPRTTGSPELFGLPGMGVISGVVFASLGVAIALRQPRNSIGWIFLACGMFTALLEPASEYGWYALMERDGMLPGGDWAIWLTALALPLGLGPILTYVLLVFPNGQLPSARWRPVAWYTVASLVAVSAAGTLVFTTVGYGPYAWANPVSLGFALELDATARQLVITILVGPAALLCAAAFVHRLRGSRGVERQQLKLVAYAAVIAVAVTLLLPVSSGRKPLEIAKQLAILTVPLAVGLAILRYRLYDIDVLIKRTLVYGSLTVMLGLVYVVSVLLSQQLLRGFTGGSDIAVAGSTLLVVALFQPIRRRVQEVVDRRFYRARYDAARTIDAFSVRLRGDVDLDSVRADLIGVVHDTIHPAHASVWLRGGSR